MVDIPQGGTIRNAIQWESYIATGGSWYLHTLYGKKVAGIFQIYSDSYIIILNHPIGAHSNNHDLIIPIDAPVGLYDAWTIMSPSPDQPITNILAEKYDVGVLNIVPGVFAKIISTAFSKI